MTTTFKAMGDMMGFLIERSALEKLGIDEETPIVVTSDDEGLHLRPIRYASTEEVEKATTEMMEIHAETLTRLAQ